MLKSFEILEEINANLEAARKNGEPTDTEEKLIGGVYWNLRRAIEEDVGGCRVRVVGLDEQFEEAMRPIRAYAEALYRADRETPHRPIGEVLETLVDRAEKFFEDAYKKATPIDGEKAASNTSGPDEVPSC